MAQDGSKRTQDYESIDLSESSHWDSSDEKPILSQDIKTNEKKSILKKVIREAR